MVDLAAELTSSLGRVTRADLSGLYRSGVTRRTLFGLRCEGGLGGAFGMARIAGEAAAATPGLFEFDEGGARALILPCFGDDGELWDLVALDMRDSARVSTRLGIAPALGMEALSRAAFHRRRLALHRTAIDWLRSGCRGAYVIDWRSASLWVSDLPGVETDGLSFGEFVEAKIKACQPRMPKVFVNLPGGGEAA